MNEAAFLVVWLFGLFGIVCTVTYCVARLVVRDSMTYDEQFVWRRKLPTDDGDGNKD